MFVFVFTIRLPAFEKWKKTTVFIEVKLRDAASMCVPVHCTDLYRRTRKTGRSLPNGTQRPFWVRILFLSVSVISFSCFFSVGKVCVYVLSVGTAVGCRPTKCRFVPTWKLCFTFISHLVVFFSLFLSFYFLLLFLLCGRGVDGAAWMVCEAHSLFTSTKIFQLLCGWCLALMNSHVVCVPTCTRALAFRPEHRWLAVVRFQL